jgi:hypothetical protein
MAFLPLRSSAQSAGTTFVFHLCPSVAKASWNLNCLFAFMETVETLKLEIKKLSSQAVQAKMDLHDLSEELPTNWERIPEMAQKTFQIYEKLIAAKQRLAALGG